MHCQERNQQFTNERAAFMRSILWFPGHINTQARGTEQGQRSTRQLTIPAQLQRRYATIAGASSQQRRPATINCSTRYEMQKIPSKNRLIDSRNFLCLYWWQSHNLQRNNSSTRHKILIAIQLIGAFNIVTLEWNDFTDQTWPKLKAFFGNAHDTCLGVGAGITRALGCHGATHIVDTTP